MPLGNHGARLKRRFMKKGASVPKYNLTKNNSFLIFPFDLVMGYITSTENGIRSNDSVNVFDYSTFERVFTGLENVLAKWAGAYKVTKTNEDDTFLTKEYVVGDNFRGYIPQETLSATFQPTSISGDFLAEFTEETFRIHTYGDVSEEDLFKLYIVPELKEFKWLYVTSAEKFYMPNGELHHVELTLSTLNNQIAKTGRAVEEYIQRSAPGEGYAWPDVDEDGNITVDEVRSRDIPVTSFQIEGAGAYAMGAMYLFGRPTIQKTVNGVTQGTFNPKIEAPRILLPWRMETAIPSPVNTRPTAETDWMVGRFKPTLTEDFSDWKAELQATYDLTQRAKYEGVLKSVENDSVVEATNPINQGTRNFLLWDPNFKVKVNKTYKTQTDSYTGDELKLPDEVTIPELLCHNIFGLSPYSAIPLSVEQNIAWNLRSIPIIGGVASKLIFGIPEGWTNTAIKVKMDDMVLIIPASTRDYANVLIKNSDQLRIDLNTFTDEEATDTAIEASGIKATGSIFKAQYTDQFIKTINGTDYTFNTVDLGQIHPLKDEKGTDIVFADPNTKPVFLQWDGTCKPTSRNTNTPGYVIDTSTFKAIAKMDYRTTFFTNNTQVWAGTYQTTSKFTGSIRDWTNSTKYSNWSTDDNSELDYPKAIVAPNPPNVNNPIIQLPVKDFVIDTAQSLTSEWTNDGGNSADIYRVQAKRANKEYTSGVLTIDTSNYGGLNAIELNYDSIQINISESGIDSQYTISVKDLITTGKIEIKLKNFVIPEYQVQQRFGNPIPAFKPNVKITNTNIKLEITTNGDNILIRTIGDYTFSFNPTSGQTENLFWKETQKLNTVKTKSLLLQPKTI